MYNNFIEFKQTSTKVILLNGIVNWDFFVNYQEKATDIIYLQDTNNKDTSDWIHTGSYGVSIRRGSLW